MRGPVSSALWLPIALQTYLGYAHITVLCPSLKRSCAARHTQKRSFFRLILHMSFGTIRGMEPVSSSARIKQWMHAEAVHRTVLCP